MDDEGAISTHTSLAGRDQPINLRIRNKNAFLLTRPSRDVTDLSIDGTVVQGISTHTSLAGRDKNDYFCSLKCS